MPIWLGLCPIVGVDPDGRQMIRGVTCYQMVTVGAMLVAFYTTYLHTPPAAHLPA